jgi:hypothetical protein
MPFSKSIIQTVVPMAAKPITIAVTAKIVSNVPTVDGAEGARVGFDAAGGAAARGAAAEGDPPAVAKRVEAGTAGAEGREPADGAPVGPPGGNVGSLIVGAADGLGGKLMRTVSFLG